MTMSALHLPVGFIGSLGMTEVLVIGGIALLLFGKRLPEVAKSMGKSIVQFKKGLREVEEDIDEAAKDDEPKTEGPPKTDDETPPEDSAPS